MRSFLKSIITLSVTSVAQAGRRTVTAQDVQLARYVLLQAKISATSEGNTSKADSSKVKKED